MAGGRGEVAGENDAGVDVLQIATNQTKRRGDIYPERWPYMIASRGTRRKVPHPSKM